MSAGSQSCLAVFIGTFILSFFKWVYVTLFLFISLPLMNSLLRKCGEASYLISKGTKMHVNVLFL